MFGKLLLPTILALVWADVGLAQVNALPSTRHILVYGEAKARAIPDRFKIKVSFDVVDPSADVARRKVEAHLERVLDALRAAGVTEGEIVATSMEIEPRERYDQATRDQVFQGIGVSRGLTARFSDLDALEKFIAGLETSKEVQVSGIETGLQDEQALLRALRTKSIASARLKAEAVARDFGVRLAGLYSVSDVAPEFQYGVREGSWPSTYSWADEEGGTLDRIEVTGSRLEQVALQTGFVDYSDKIYAVFLIAD